MENQREKAKARAKAGVRDTARKAKTRTAKKREAKKRVARKREAKKREAKKREAKKRAARNATTTVAKVHEATTQAVVKDENKIVQIIMKSHNI